MYWPIRVGHCVERGLVIYLVGIGLLAHALAQDPCGVGFCTQIKGLWRDCGRVMAVASTRWRHVQFIASAHSARTYFFTYEDLLIFTYDNGNYEQ